MLRVAVPLAVLSAGCAITSQSSTYDGDVRFEHCNRLDEEANVPVRKRLACWQSWRRSHARGQTRDRIDYAATRERELTAAWARGEGDTLPIEGSSLGHEPTGASIASPAPTTPYAPPPKTLAHNAENAQAALEGPASSLSARLATSAQTPPPAPPASLLDSGSSPGRASTAAGLPPTGSRTLADAPRARCGSACAHAWLGCATACTEAPCRPQCDDRYRSCMKSCF